MVKEDYLTVPVFAVSIGVGNQAILKAIRKGRIEAIKLDNGQWRIPRSEVDGYRERKHVRETFRLSLQHQDVLGLPAAAKVVAKELGKKFKELKLYNDVVAGHVKVNKVGRDLLVTKEDLYDYIERLRSINEKVMVNR